MILRVLRLLWLRGKFPQREAADDIWVTIIQLSPAVRKRAGSSSPLRAAAIIRWQRRYAPFEAGRRREALCRQLKGFTHRGSCLGLKRAMF